MRRIVRNLRCASESISSDERRTSLLTSGGAGRARPTDLGRLAVDRPAQRLKKARVHDGGASGGRSDGRRMGASSGPVHDGSRRARPRGRRAAARRVRRARHGRAARRRRPRGRTSTTATTSPGALASGPARPATVVGARAGRGDGDADGETDFRQAHGRRTLGRASWGIGASTASAPLPRPGRRADRPAPPTRGSRVCGGRGRTPPRPARARRARRGHQPDGTRTSRHRLPERLRAGERVAVAGEGALVVAAAQREVAEADEGADASAGGGRAGTAVRSLSAAPGSLRNAPRRARGRARHHRAEAVVARARPTASSPSRRARARSPRAASTSERAGDGLAVGFARVEQASHVEPRRGVDAEAGERQVIDAREQREHVGGRVAVEQQRRGDEPRA